MCSLLTGTGHHITIFYSEGIPGCLCSLSDDTVGPSPKCGSEHRNCKARSTPETGEGKLIPASGQLEELSVYVDINDVFIRTVTV